MNNLQRSWAMIIGIILIVVGIWGFFQQPVLSLFGVNPAHNIVHIVTGLIFAWAGFSKGTSAMPVNKWLGVIYIFVGIIGFAGLLTFLEVQAGAGDLDNWLHLIIGLVSAAIGWFAK